MKSFTTAFFFTANTPAQSAHTQYNLIPSTQTIKQQRREKKPKVEHTNMLEFRFRISSVLDMYVYVVYVLSYIGIHDADRMFPVKLFRATELFRRDKCGSAASVCLSIFKSR